MFGLLRLTAADLPTLTAYCQQVSQGAVACARFTAEGAILTTPRGSVVEHPAIRQCERAQALILKLGGALGLNPLGRKTNGPAPEGESAEEREEMRLLFGEDKPHPRRPRRHEQEKACEEVTEADPSAITSGGIDGAGVSDAENPHEVYSEPEPASHSANAWPC